jgi:hypothetical protein
MGYCGSVLWGWPSRLARILAKIDEESLEVVRVAFADIHGIVRVGSIEARLFAERARERCPSECVFE